MLTIMTSYEEPVEEGKVETEIGAVREQKGPIEGSASNRSFMETEG
jgi:hypothetical protein